MYGFEQAEKNEDIWLGRQNIIALFYDKSIMIQSIWKVFTMFEKKIISTSYLELLYTKKNLTF